MTSSARAWGCAVLVAAASVAGVRSARAEMRVAVVDMQRALNECSAGRTAKDKVKSKFERAQDELKRQREDLDRRREDYEKKAAVLREEERRNLEKDLEGRTLDFKRKYEDFQRDLKRTDAELTSGIVEQLYGIVSEYGKEQGYTLVFEASSGSLLYADQSLDITDAIVKIHDSSPNRGRAPKGDDD